MTSLRETCSSLQIERGSFLRANVRQPNGTTLSQTIDLNGYIGISSGRLTWGGTNFSTHSEYRSAYVAGMTLTAQIQLTGSLRTQSSTLDLNEYLEVRSGQLVSKSSRGPAPPTPATPSQNIVRETTERRTEQRNIRDESRSEREERNVRREIITTETSRVTILSTRSRNVTLQDETILYADCINRENIFVASKIDLNEWVGYFDGNLHWGFEGFKENATNIRLEGDFILVVVYASGPVTLDLSKYLRVDNGTLTSVYSKHTKGGDDMSIVPWANFQIIARPNFKHIVRQVSNDQVESIASTIVEENSQYLNETITKAVEEAIKTAIEHMTKTVTERLTTTMQHMLMSRAELFWATTTFQPLVKTKPGDLEYVQEGHYALTH